jgi:hypothetical protein
VREDGGVRLGLADTSVSPRYPARAGAATAASDWVAAAQACGSAADAYAYEGSLLGELGVREGLCGRAGSAITGEVEALDALRDPTVVLTAFSEGAADWAAVVEVTGLDGVAPLHVVLAPLGDRWVVVAVMSAS